MSHEQTVFDTHLSGFNRIHQGKVRDVYEIDDQRLLLVASDRISAFDCVMPNVVPYKGEVLTKLSEFWFEKLDGVTSNHLISTNLNDFPEKLRALSELEGRSSLVKRTEVFPVECVVRGYLEGSGWKDYQRTGEVCGHKLPPGMKQCEKLPAPLFTPATKAASGHDENISEKRFADVVGEKVASILKATSLDIYLTASEYARSKGIIIADTKFEFGVDTDEKINLIDEVLTPDSSRFWDADAFEPGRAQASFDKQYVREYLETLDWNKKPPAPKLPGEIVKATTSRYLEAFKLLTGRDL